MLVSPYLWANAMASSVVTPISSVMAEMRDLSHPLARSAGAPAATAAAAAKSSRLVIDGIVSRGRGRGEAIKKPGSFGERGTSECREGVNGRKPREAEGWRSHVSRGSIYAERGGVSQSR